MEYDTESMKAEWDKVARHTFKLVQERLDNMTAQEREAYEKYTPLHIQVKYRGFDPNVITTLPALNYQIEQSVKKMRAND